MKLIPQQWIEHFLASQGLSPVMISWTALIIGIVVTVIVARVGLTIGRSVLRVLTDQLLHRISSRTAEHVRSANLPSRLAHLVPLFLLSHTILPLFSQQPKLIAATKDLLSLYLLLIAGMIIDALLNILGHWLAKHPNAHRIPYEGMIQLFKIIASGLLIILGLAALLNKSPLYLLSGLGAVSAILMLVFKDTLLGFVAGIQLSFNDMLRRGDWIEMPKYGADGDVLALTLNTVKVRNWDMTITTIPAYALISDAFKNWRGMQNAGGRRIKRAFVLDINSVTFVSPEVEAQLHKMPLLAPWLAEQGGELSQKTNVAALRAYITAFIRSHPKVHQDMIMLVRHRETSGRGLPIEIYCFSSDLAWANYEALQADIFEHIFAILPQFHLNLFQVPTGGQLSPLHDGVEQGD